MRGRRGLEFLMILVFGFFLWGCGRAATEGHYASDAAATYPGRSPVEEAPMPPRAPTVAPSELQSREAGGGSPYYSGGSAQARAEGWAPKGGATQVGDASAKAAEEKPKGPLLIYTAEVHLAVFEADKAVRAAEALMKSFDGYLVQRSQRSITFRVPAEKFQSVLDAVLELGDVLHEDVKARDVTDEFHDVGTRLQTLESLRARLADLLDRTQKVEEALAVERELGRIISQIEQLKGRLKLMRELVAFSTVTLNFQPREVERTVESKFSLPFPWLRTLGLGPLLAL